MWVNGPSLVTAPLLLGLLVPEVLATNSTQHLLCLETPATAAQAEDAKSIHSIRSGQKGGECLQLLLSLAIAWSAAAAAAAG